MGQALPHPGGYQPRMSHPFAPMAVHRTDGRAFLGLRKCRNGSLEIIYEKFGVRKSVWEVIDGNAGLDCVQEACLRAINTDDCLSTLHAALAKAAVRIECKEDRFGYR